MTAQEIQAWLATLAPGSTVHIDDGGLTLVVLDAAGQSTGAHLEIGGIPQPE